MLSERRRRNHISCLYCKGADGRGRGVDGIHTPMFRITSYMLVKLYWLYLLQDIIKRCHMNTSRYVNYYMARSLGNCEEARLQVSKEKQGN